MAARYNATDEAPSICRSGEERAEEMAGRRARRTREPTQLEIPDLTNLAGEAFDRRTTPPWSRDETTPMRPSRRPFWALVKENRSKVRKVMVNSAPVSSA